MILRLTDVVFNNTSLPKLYNDSVITTSTQFLYDALNTMSYAKQAAPAAGNPSVDKWTNLVNLSASGILYNQDGLMSWGANGGFTSNAGTYDRIILDNGIVPATAPSKFLGVIWIKHGLTQVDGSPTQSIASFCRMMEIRHATVATTNVADNRFYVSGNCTGNAEIPLGDTTLLGGSVLQLAVAYDSSTLTGQIFANGVLVKTFGGYAVLGTPSEGFNVFYRTGAYNDYKGTAYRCLYDTLTGIKSASDIVAMDYAVNKDRFS